MLLSEGAFQRANIQSSYTEKSRAEQEALENRSDGGPFVVHMEMFGTMIKNDLS